MPPQFVLLAFSGPLALLLAAAFARWQPGLRPGPVRVASIAAAGMSAGAAVAFVALVALHGPQTSPLLGIGGVGLSLRLDPLSVAIYTMVSFVGLIVVRFSCNYLDGDPRQGAFLGRLSLTLAAVSLLVLAGNLVQLAVAWVATSLALHGLLLFHRGRPRAVAAARKKFITARIGDVCLITAIGLLAHAFGSTDIATILDMARDAQAAAGPAVAVASLLVAVAAILKSAQFPTQAWLTEVMETPTPVSALLHAGIVNAGGFLVLRLADVMLMHAPSLHLLAAVGAVTALVGSVVAIAQTSVKVGLAWSTVAQMGFMLMQCGFGAFALAVLHIVAHSAYKAHAFLSSGSTVGADGRRPAGGTATVPAGAVLPATAVACGAAVLAALADDPVAPPAVVAVFALGLVHLAIPLCSDLKGRAAVALPLALIALLAGLYVALHAGAAALLASAVPARAVGDDVGSAIAVVAIATFSAVGLLYLLGPPRLARRAAEAVYVHAINGFYTNALFERLAGASRAAGGRS